MNDKGETMKVDKGDLWPVQGAAFEDLNRSNIDEYMHRREQKLGRKIEEPVEKFLTNTGILIEQDGKQVPTAGGILLFGKAPQHFLWFSSVSLIRFKGKDVGDVIIDRKEARGTVPEMIESAAQFMVKHMKMGGRIEGIQRKDIPEYPLVIVREAVINAIVHRDYSMQSVSVRIFMFDDRVEIYTPGGLPGPVTIENMEFTQYSRNKVIVEGLTYLGDYMERLGTGIRRIKTIAKRSGLKEPRFVDTGIDFILTLFAPVDRPLEAVKTIAPKEQQTPPQIKAAEERHLSRHEHTAEARAGRPSITILLVAAIAIVAVFFIISERKEKNDPAKQYQAASKFHSEQKYDKAIKQYKYFIQNFPGDRKAPDAQYYLATAYEITGSEEEALKEYQGLISNYPHSDKAGYAQYWIGAIYLKQRLLAKASEAFEILIKNYPGSPFKLDALHSLADIYYEQNRLEDTINACKEALGYQDDIFNGYEYYQMGICQMQLGRLKDARENFNNVISNSTSDNKWIEKSKEKMKELVQMLKKEDARSTPAKESVKVVKEEPRQAPAPSPAPEPEPAKAKELPQAAQVLDKKEIYLQQAKVYYQQGKYQQAADLWKEVLTFDVFNKEAKEGIDAAMSKLKGAER